jgi:hypothetical protein
MEFSQLLSQISIRHLRVEVKLKHPLNAPAFLGSTLHGSAGWALKKAAPQLWSLAYGDSQVKYMRFANLPKLADRTGAGEYFTFDWWLYGPLAETGNYLLPMLTAWGKQGILNAEFTLHKLQQIDPLDRQTLLYIAPLTQQSVTLPPDNLLQRLELMTWHFDTIAHNYGHELNCVITANSTITLKQQQQICQQAVDINTLLASIARRVISLATIVSPTPYPVHDFLPAVNAALICDQSQVTAHVRKKQQERQTMRGICGYWVYQGDLHDALPWLCIGQWLGIGNKTSFGFGDYSWQVLA